MAKKVCGIDFGTSNSAIAVGEGDAVRLVPIEGDSATIPTAIFFNFDEGRPAYGRHAVTEYLDGYTGRLMRSLKSILGSSLMNDRTQVGQRRLDFKDIIGLFVGHVRETAQRQTGCELDSVVMGRPVFFVDENPDADKRAEDELRAIAVAQGFKDVLFEYEPIAAARDYESTLTKEELVLVVDIGGGTSDFSLIRLSPDLKTKADRSDDILANSGVHIGGTDFDKQFSLSEVLPDFGYNTMLNDGLGVPKAPYHDLATWHKIHMLYNPKTTEAVNGLCRMALEKEKVQRLARVIENYSGHQLANAVERAKIALSDSDDVGVDMGFVENAWVKTLTKEQLQQACAAHVERIVSHGEQTVTALSGVNGVRVDTVYMTGGSTLLPGFEGAIRAVFPGARIVYGDQFSSVARGLGISAMHRFG